MIRAIAMVKNEEDVIGYNIGHLLNQGVDQVIVADNLSTDKTLDILLDFMNFHPPERFYCFPDNEIGYYQSRKMTNWANEFCDEGDWVIPFDADEIWFSRMGTIADTLNNCTADVIVCPVWHMVAKQNCYGNPFEEIKWRAPNPEKMPVVAFRWTKDAVIHQGNHDVTHPGSRSWHDLEVKHFQYRSFDQFVRKVRIGKVAYDATDLDNGQGYHWRMYGGMSIHELVNEWNNLRDIEDLVYDPV